MGKQLTIKGHSARELAGRLSRLTGESLTHAVVRALEERLETESQKRAPSSETEISATTVAAVDPAKADN